MFCFEGYDRRIISLLLHNLVVYLYMENILDNIETDNPEALLADGFNDAIIGMDIHGCVVYDYDKCIRILMENDSMSNIDAIEFMDYNVTGAYVGEYTPVFIKTYG